MQRTIQRMSKAVKLDLPYYLSGSFWLTLSRFVTVLLSLILSILFARFTLPAFYGQYKFTLSVFSLLAILALPGIRVEGTLEESLGPAEDPERASRFDRYNLNSTAYAKQQL